MWEFIKNKLAKLGCFVLIALMMIATTAITKLVLGWFHHDDASKEALSSQIGGYVGKGLLGLVVLFGFIIMGRQLIAELRGKSSSPPPTSSTPPPLLTQPQSGSGINPMTTPATPNPSYAPQRTRPSRSGCNRGVPRVGQLNWPLGHAALMHRNTTQTTNK